MSARNRELLGLFPVAMLITAGFTGVYAARSTDLGSASLTYGAVFLGLCLAVHLFIRATLPNADPYLFPLVALLAAIGLVMLYRIDEGLARDQANWFVVGLVLFVLTITFLRDYHVLERYRYAAGGHRSRHLGALLLFSPGLGGGRVLPRLHREDREDAEAADLVLHGLHGRHGRLDARP